MGTAGQGRLEPVAIKVMPDEQAAAQEAQNLRQVQQAGQHFPGRSHITRLLDYYAPGTLTCSTDTFLMLR